MKITVLGCGTSGGVPLIGCSCAVCKSENPKDKRSRSSVLVEKEKTKVLLDTPPDFRSHCLTHNIRKLDGVLYTHDHADHTHGIDDLRSLNHINNKPVDIYSDGKTLDTIQQRFPYAFGNRSDTWAYPLLIPVEIRPYEKFKIGDLEILPFEQEHGYSTSLGFRFGNFAYSSDAKELSEEAFKALEGVEIWIVDCVGYKPLPTHSHLEQTLDWIARVKPKQAILTHMSHRFDYEDLKKELPQGVEPGYDGMVLEVLFNGRFLKL